MPRSAFIVFDQDNLKNEINPKNFPREIRDDWMKKVYLQQIEYYVDCKLIEKN